MCELHTYLASYSCSMSQVSQYIGNYSTKNSSICIDYKAYGTTGCKKDHFMADTSYAFILYTSIHVWFDAMSVFVFQHACAA